MRRPEPKVSMVFFPEGEHAGDGLAWAFPLFIGK
jgi:hypothetical protein